MNTKKLIKSYFPILILFAFSLLPLYSQQEPLYTQYMFNTLSVNPAYAGTVESVSFTGLTRYQWIGLDGAPRTFSFSLQAPVNSKSMGLGFSVVRDEVGPTNNTYVSASYGYRVNLTDEVKLSMGLKAGFYSYYIGLRDLDIINVTDPSFQENIERKFNPNIGAGLYLYSEKWYAGFSVPTLIENAFDKNAQNYNALSNFKRHYYLMGAYNFTLSEEWAIKPSIVEKAVSGSPFSTDLTVQLIYKDRYWVGTSYRIGDAVAFLLEAKVTPQLMIGYSYDVTFSRLSSYSNGCHEILLSFDLGKKGSTGVKDQGVIQ